MASNHNTENMSKQHRRSSKIEPVHFPPVHNGTYYQIGGIKTIKVLATYINLDISDRSFKEKGQLELVFFLLKYQFQNKNSFGLTLTDFQTKIKELYRMEFTKTCFFVPKTLLCYFQTFSSCRAILVNAYVRGLTFRNEC